MNPQNLEFSIVIPTYNRPERLAQCLQSLTQLDYPRDRFEVIIVDDGSHIALDAIAVRFETHLSISLIRQNNAGPASARNTGAAAAQGHYLVFTDDDCQPDFGWLKELAAAVAEVPDALIGGHTVNALPDNLCSTASQLLIDYIYDYYNYAKGEATFFASNNFAMPRLLYQQLGGFDTTFPLAAGEDREFCDRWRYKGFSMHYAAAMQVHHAHNLSLASFWRQHFNYGRGAFYFHKIRSQRQSQPIKVEPLTFYSKLLIYPFSQLEGWRSWNLSGLFCLSQVANVAGFFWERYQQRSSLSKLTTTSS
ncbi:MAG: glycosyltransferase [Cyanobacteria bacterium P01_A01_bin.123]